MGKMKFLLFLLFSLASPYVLSGDISGDWYQSCSDEYNYHLNIPKGEIGVMEILSNQVYVNARFDGGKDDIFIYYSSTADLGRGGMMYDWDNFSKVIPIAKITHKKDNEIVFKWKGFFNKKNKSYEIVDEFYKSKNDFSSEVKMYRCNQK